MVSGVEHLATFIFVARGHDHHFRNAAQEGEIERSLVGLTVGADDARTIDCKQHRQLLNGDVMDHLIVSALQEGGIDRHDRLIAANRHPGGKGHRVLFGNRDIEIAIGEFFRELDHPGPFTHRRGDGHQFVVFGRGFAQPVAKDFRIGRQAAAAFRQHAAGVIEFRYRVEGDGIFFRRFISTAFFGHDVQELRPFQVAHILQRIDQTQYIVAIYRADVVKAHLFKQRAGHHHTFNMFFGTLKQFFNRRYAGEDFFAAFTQRGIQLAGQQLRQVIIQRPDVF